MSSNIMKKMMMMMIVLLLLVSQHASGVEVYEGAESVLLPCQVPVNVSRSSTSTTWERDELNNPTVHLRLQSGDDLKHQNDRYLGRTSMRGDALQTGDLSLTLRKPTVSDSGTYTCTARRFGEAQSRTDVQLKVTEPPPVWPTVLLAVLVIVVILVILAAAFVCCANKRMKTRDLQVEKVEVVEVPQGVKSVLLPFETTADLRQGEEVEWRLTEPNYMKVHLYESGDNQPDEQDERYRGRTEMKGDPLRTGDLSLTLKDLRFIDSGVYTCRVNKKDGDVLLQKSVTLSVTDKRMCKLEQAVYGDKSLKLPFKKPRDLPDNSTVKWELIYPKYKLIKTTDQHQGCEEDLSLTLEDLRPTDSGLYTCSVYNKHGPMLLLQSVILSVRDFQVEVVEVPEGEKSVLLPFKTTTALPHGFKVVWTDSKDMVVHLYKSGKDQLDNQGERYRHRTEMKGDPLRTGDVSLTLKDPRPTDSGVYTCRVNNKDRHKLLHKSVTLRVRATLVGTMADMLPRLRRRTAPASQLKEEPRNTNQEEDRLMGVQSA